MIHNVNIHATSGQLVAHIDKPTTMRAQAMQYEKDILAICYPTSQEKITPI
jgi:hypothetical protein